MSEEKRDGQLMTEGSIPKHIIKFAIPLLVGNLLQQSYNLVDMIIVGRCINDGGLSIAAVGVGASFINMMIGLFMGISTGASIVISNAYGAGKMKRVRTTINLSLAMSAAMSVVLTVVSIGICEWILRLLNTTDDIFDLAAVYLKIYFLGFIPLLVYNMGTSILQAMGNSKSPFYYLASTCVLNLALDLVFLKIFHTGVGGAAAATVIANVVACLLVLRKISLADLLSLPKFGAGAGGHGDAVRHPERNLYLLGTIFRYGIPIGIQSLTMSLSNMVLQGNLNLLGTDVIAAWSIFCKIDGYIIMPAVSFRMAITTFTGQNFGAKRLDRVESGRRIVTLMSVGSILVLGVVIMALCEPIIMIFDPTESILECCKEMARCMIPFYFTLAIINAYTGVFNGLGKAAVGSATMIFCMCILRVTAVSVAFPIMHSTMAIYLAYYVSWFACMFILMGLYHFRVKRELKL